MVGVERDDTARTRVSRLRYVRKHAADRIEVESDWALHWFSPAHFTALAEEAGLSIAKCVEWNGDPANESSTGFTAVLER